MDTKNQLITGFLWGMYYSGKLPECSEVYQIAEWLRSYKLVDGPQDEVEERIMREMQMFHEQIAHEHVEGAYEKEMQKE